MWHALVSALGSSCQRSCLFAGPPGCRHLASPKPQSTWLGRSSAAYSCHGSAACSTSMSLQYMRTKSALGRCFHKKSDSTWTAFLGHAEHVQNAAGSSEQCCNTCKLEYFAMRPLQVAQLLRSMTCAGPAMKFLR